MSTHERGITMPSKGDTLLVRLRAGVADFHAESDAQLVRIRHRVGVLREVELRLGVREGILNGANIALIALQGELLEADGRATLKGSEMFTELIAEVHALRHDPLVAIAEQWVGSGKAKELHAKWAFHTACKDGDKRSQQRDRVRTVVAKQAGRGWLPAVRLQAVIAMWDMIPGVIQAETNKMEREAAGDRARLYPQIQVQKDSIASALCQRDLYRYLLRVSNACVEPWELELVGEPKPAVVEVAKTEFEKAVTVEKVVPTPAPKVARMAKVSGVVPTRKPGGNLEHREAEFLEICNETGFAVTEVTARIAKSSGLSQVEFVLPQGKTMTINLTKNWQRRVRRIAEKYA